MVRKGDKLSEEHKKKISLKMKGKMSGEKHPNWKGGISKVEKDYIKKDGIHSNSIVMKGRFGEKCNSWKGGTTKLDKLIRESLAYKQWRSSCMTRDNWTCKTCNKRGVELQVHHKKSMCEILKDNNIKRIEEALSCKELFDINNGVTLCLDCHKQTDTYASKIHLLLKKIGSSSIFEPALALNKGGRIMINYKEVEE